MPIIGGFGRAATDRDLALRKEMALLQELEEQAKIAELTRRKADPLEAAKMQASVRHFETRRGVRELGDDAPADSSPVVPSPRLGMQSPVSAERVEPPIRMIRRAAPPAEPEREDVTTQFGTSPQTRTIRRFTDQGTPFTDPDAAMGAEQRARLHPSVLSAEADAKGRQGPVAGNAALARMVRDNPALLSSLSPTARSSVLAEIAGSGETLNIPDPQKAAAESTQAALDGVNRLLHHPGIGAATGAYDPRAAFGGLTQGAVDFNAERDKVVAALTLPNLGQLKGPLSDKDILFVKQLATTLSNARQSSPATRAELERAKAFLQNKLSDGGPSTSAGGTERTWGRDASGKLVPQ